MIEETHSLKCQYKGVQPYIKVTAYELSSVDCSSDKTSGYYGETATLTANAAPAGYNFSGWNITGSNMTGNSFRFQGDVTAKANYSAIQYNVTLQNDGHGTITASKTTGNIGDTITLSNTPNSHYGFSGYSITGSTLTGNAFKIGTSNVTAKGWFSAVPANTLTLQTDGHGKISANKTTGYQGDTVTLSNTASAGYVFKNYTVTGATINGSTLTFGAGNTTAKALFSAIPTYTLTLQTDGHGKLTANKLTGHAGDTVTLTPTNSSYYRFNNYSNTGGSINGNTFTFGNGNATAKANFKTNNVTITGVWELDSYYGRPTYNSTYNSWENGKVYSVVKAVTGGYNGTIGAEFDRSQMSSWAMSAHPIVYITGTNGKDKYVSAYFDNSNAYTYSERDVYVHGTNQVVGTTTGTRKLGCSGGGTGTNGMTNPNVKFEVGEPTTTTMPRYSFGGGWTATGIAK